MSAHHLSRLLRPGYVWLRLRSELRKGPRLLWFESVVSPTINRWRSPLVDHPPMPVPLHTVGGHQHVRMAAWMLASFVEATQRNWDVWFHDDGSLTPGDIRFLSNFMPTLRVIQRSIADETMGERLANYPRCRQYREQIPLALKCFDVPKYVNSDDGRFLLIDPDILFWGTPNEIVDWAELPSATNESRACWFNRDPLEPSPVSSTHAKEQWNITIWSQVNSGLCLLNTGICRLSDFETWLSDPALLDAKLWRKEQTLLALAASQAGLGGLLAPKYEVSLGRTHHPESVCRHYVGAVRDRFWTEGIRKVHSNIFR